MADYPTNYPSFTDLDGQATLAANNHAARHNKVHAEVSALAQRVGKTGDTNATTHEKKIADLQSGLGTANTNIAAVTASTATNTANIATNTANIAANLATLTALGGVAVKTTDTNTSGYGFVVDEDDMISDSASKLPTQQSVKAYVDSGDKWTYSTSEVDTGKKWIDGRAVYRKVINTTVTLAVSSANNVSTGITGATSAFAFISITGGVNIGSAVNTTAQTFMYRETGGNWMSLTSTSPTTLSFTSSFAWGTTRVIAALEYVK